MRIVLRPRTRSFLPFVPLALLLLGPACRRDGSAPSGSESVPRPSEVDAVVDVPAVGGELAEPVPGVDGSTAVAALPPIADLDEFRRVARPVVCERNVRCGVLGRGQLADCLADDGTRRPDVVLGLWEELGIGAVVESGGLTWDAAGTSECVAFLAAAPCRYDPPDAPEDCQPYWPVLRAATAPGEPCSRWEQCTDGFCPSQPGCSQRCVARAATGGACGSDMLCGEDDFCLDGTCVPQRGEGEECPGHWQACRDGLWCKGYVPENEDPEWGHPPIPGKCARPREVGESCAEPYDTDDHCRFDLYCDWGMREPECRERLGEGAECRWLDACADGLACRGLRLGGRHPAGHRFDVLAGGTCLPFLDLGDGCDPEADVDGCPSSMTCDPAARTCGSTGHEGDPCESSWVPEGTPDDRPIRRRGCRGGLYCDVETRVCRRQLAEGEPCEPRRQNEDETCFLSACDEHTGRCRPRCGDR
jgi:hypothetical protein